MHNEADYKAELIARYTLKSGLKGKITAKCIECIYDPHSGGNWRNQVEKCTSFDCPLYPVRPIPKQIKSDSEKDPKMVERGRKLAAMRR